MEQTVTENPLPLNSNSSQISEFLQEHGEVEMILPVMLGLFITSRFQLRGANALLVNLAVASISRQIFRELKSSKPDSPPTNSSQPSTPPVNFFGDGYSIVHSVPGRIRLRLEKLGEDVNFAKRLERLLNAEDCVTKVRINRLAHSLVIYYESGQLTELDLGLRLMSIIQEASQEAA